MRLHVHMHTNAHKYTYKHTFPLCMHLDLSREIHTYTHIYVEVYFARSSTLAEAFTHTHIHTHAYTHVYCARTSATHIYKCLFSTQLDLSRGIQRFQRNEIQAANVALQVQRETLHNCCNGQTQLRHSQRLSNAVPASCTEGGHVPVYVDVCVCV